MTFTPVPKTQSEPKARKPLRRQTPLPRPTKPLQRGGPIARRTPVKKRGRKGARFPRLIDRAYRAWIRRLPCLVRSLFCDAAARPDCAHVQSRGAGGADRGNCVSLCRVHHEEQHRIGIKSFQAKYDLDLQAEAVRLDALYAQEMEWAA